MRMERDQEKERNIKRKELPLSYLHTILLTADTVYSIKYCIMYGDLESRI